MEEYRYTYLLMGVLFFIIWLILFIYRKDTRRPMLTVSLLISVVGPLSNILYMHDWWNPLTIWGPEVGILESLLVAFSAAGIMCVIYEDVFKKKIKLRKRRNRTRDNERLLLLAIMIDILICTLFYVFEFNSFISINAGLLFALIVMLAHRTDLVAEAVVSGILTLVVVIIVYSGLEFLTPGWIDAFWYWQNMPRLIILNVPIDDIVNYLLIGACLGILYEYWQEGKLVKLREH